MIAIYLGKLAIDLLHAVWSWESTLWSENRNVTVCRALLRGMSTLIPLITSTRLRRGGRFWCVETQLPCWEKMAFHTLLRISRQAIFLSLQCAHECVWKI